MPRALAAGLLGGVVAAWGLWIDRSQPLPQGSLFAALHFASLGGAALGAAYAWPRFPGALQRLGLLVTALLAWRVSYFPIMVFSGHIASIAEWIEIGLGLPVFVYPVFLLAVTTIHVLALIAATFLLKPPHALVPVVLVPAFTVALLVSFSTFSDLTLLPDEVVAIDEPVPPMREAVRNPYLPKVTAPGYAFPQRVILVAAGLTYETIPESPWGRTVKAVLEGLFDQKPNASTHDRVLEHYLAYHSAHGLIGCRDPAACPVEPAPAAGSEAPPAPRAEAAARTP